MTMNILGMLEDGTIFADTVSEGAPITATATETDLFPGWLEDCCSSKRAAKARLTIPPIWPSARRARGGNSGQCDDHHGRGC